MRVRVVRARRKETPQLFRERSSEIGRSVVPVTGGIAGSPRIGRRGAQRASVQGHRGAAPASRRECERHRARRPAQARDPCTAPRSPSLSDLVSPRRTAVPGWPALTTHSCAIPSISRIHCRALGCGRQPYRDKRRWATDGILAVRAIRAPTPASARCASSRSTAQLRARVIGIATGRRSPPADSLRCPTGAHLTAPFARHPLPTHGVARTGPRQTRRRRLPPRIAHRLWRPHARIDASRAQ